MPPRGLNGLLYVYRIQTRVSVLTTHEFIAWVIEHKHILEVNICEQPINRGTQPNNTQHTTVKLIVKNNRI